MKLGLAVKLWLEQSSLYLLEKSVHMVELCTSRSGRRNSEVQTWSGELGFFVKVRVELGFSRIAALCAGVQQSTAIRVEGSARNRVEKVANHANQGWRPSEAAKQGPSAAKY